MGDTTITCVLKAQVEKDSEIMAGSKKNCIFSVPELQTTY